MANTCAKCQDQMPESRKIPTCADCTPLKKDEAKRKKLTHCENCKAKLRSTNPGPLCSPCQHDPRFYWRMKR